MIQSEKRELELDTVVEKPKKKPKLANTSKGEKTKADQNINKIIKPKSVLKNTKQTTTEKPDWRKFKQEKKELKLKRKKTNKLYDVILEAKSIFETLRQKRLRGSTDERNNLISKLHSLFVGKSQYCKVIFAHDIARVVQFMFKFSNESIRKDIADELIPVSVDMIQSKYGRNCLKSMLKYGNNEIRSAAIKKMYGNAVKLSSHLISASVFEYAYSTWATTQQKQDLIQEFFGDMYKSVKDPEVKHLRDVYKNSPTMKTAALQATKANLLKVLNKDLLDSGLIQTVLSQFLSECSPESRMEFVSQLASHVVVLSNSKDGVRAAMQCIWQGTNKDKKIIMKAIKEHIKDLSKHEHGHSTVIALLDAVDDTVLLNKMIISQLTVDINELVTDEHGRKVLLWLISPGDSAHFHPLFIKELDGGRESSTSKKPIEQRRQELLNYTIFILINEIIAKTEFWLSTASIALVTLAAIKSAPDDFLRNTLQSIAKTITNAQWSIDKEAKTLAIEDSGLHMMLKKLAQNDKILAAAKKFTFGEALLSEISDETIKKWLKLNRGCFLFVTIYENGSEEIQQQLKEKLSTYVHKLEKQKSSGAKILLQKLNS